MENAHLPLEKAQEPNEAAHQPINKNANYNKDGVKVKKITFAENTLSSEASESQRSCSTYKDALSQPAPGLSHRQLMTWLQSRRTTGLWVNCDDCSNWRYLPHVLDSHELPQKWYCRMNPDPTAADCSIPEAPLCIRDEEDLIHSEYSAGSLVWARMPGWPWWPAMVDDCPDVEQFYWLDGFSDIPTHYNVVFFDASDVTRSWVATEHLKPYSTSKDNLKTDKKNQKRLMAAIKQANDAEKLSLTDRLAKYSFISRYSGNINTPKKVTKNELEKYKNKLKRKYNIEFSEGSGSDSGDESVGTTPARKTNKFKTITKSKPKKLNKPKVNPNNVEVANTPVEIVNSHLTGVMTDPDANVAAKNDTESTMITDLNPDAKQANSLAVQIGGTAPSVPVEQSFDNDTSTTYVPGTGSENVSEVPTSVRDIIDAIEHSDSQNSDDFEF